MKAPHIVCRTLFRNPAHYLGMHTIKEGTLNAVNNVDSRKEAEIAKDTEKWKILGLQSVAILFMGKCSKKKKKP